MEEFIRQSNIRQFRKQLAECTDASRRKILERLLQEQQSLGQLAFKPTKAPSESIC